MTTFRELVEAARKNGFVVMIIGATDTGPIIDEKLDAAWARDCREHRRADVRACCVGGRWFVAMELPVEVDAETLNRLWSAYVELTGAPPLIDGDEPNVWQTMRIRTRNEAIALARRLVDIGGRSGRGN